MVDQEMYLQAAIGQPQYYRTCPGIFFCGNVPYESEGRRAGRPDLDRARQLMKESGYDGRPVVVLDPTDRPELHGAALVTRELLSKIGVNVDLQARRLEHGAGPPGQEGSAERRRLEPLLHATGSRPTPSPRP